VAFLLLLMVAGSILLWWWTRSVIPRLDGRIPVPGLHAPVKVQYDHFAIPHIYTSSTDDAWRTVGFLQARDRLWQMELYRRAASGRLSEILGESTLAADQRFLTLGLRKAAEIEWDGSTATVRRALENYAAGVNAAIDLAGQWRLPLELQVLSARPEPWTPVDTLAIGKLFAWRLGENHSGELLRFELFEALGSRSAELFPSMPTWAPVILADAEERKTTNEERGSWVDLDWLSDSHHALSNSWVVSGARTRSGRPLLANDPHLPIEMPSVWWEVQIESVTDIPDGRKLHVAGVTIPGIPFVLIGHNERIGWGLTNVGADVQDFYVERLDEKRTRYRVGNEWLPLQVEHHVIRIRGKARGLEYDVRRTRHGAVLNTEDWRDLAPGDSPQSARISEYVLALKWDAITNGESAGAFEELSYAGNWDDFIGSIRRFSAPSQNFVYADVDGNIGYAMSGLLPERSRGLGEIPMIGWTEEAEWKGERDPATLPLALNPPTGQFVTANNEVDRNLPYVVTVDWVAPFRARRIEQLLAGRRDLTAPDMVAIQTDITSAAADAVLRALGTAVPEELRQWDRKVDGRPVSTFYEAFEAALWRRTFADEMPQALYDRFYRYAANERFAGLRAVIDDPNSAWFDDRRTTGVRETRDDMAKAAAQDARETLQAAFPQESDRDWSRVHALKFAHPLSGGGWLLDRFFSRGPVPVAGDGMTVNKTATNLRRPYGTSDAASYRQILDVGSWDQSLAVNTTGQSGHPTSAHYFDQNPLWSSGGYHLLPFSRQAVDAATVSTLELVLDE